MAIALSAAEQDAIASKLRTAIKARFPDARNSIELHTYWPKPKPVAEILWMLLEDPVALFLDGKHTKLFLDAKHKELFLSLPEILSTTPGVTIEPSGIYGEKLGQYYDEVSAQSERPRATRAASKDQSQPDLGGQQSSDLNTPNAAGSLISGVADAVIERLEARGLATPAAAPAIAAAIVDELAARGLAIPARAEAVEEDAARASADSVLAPSSSREPVQDGSAGQVLKIARKSRVHWSSILLSDSVFLKSFAPELLDALTKAGFKTKADLATAVILKKGISKSAASVMVDALMTGQIFHRRSQTVMVNESIKIIPIIAGLPEEAAFAGAIKAEQERRAASGNTLNSSQADGTSDHQEFEGTETLSLASAFRDSARPAVGTRVAGGSGDVQEDHPMVLEFIALGFELSDARTLVDIGIDSYEGVVASLGNEETVQILGLSTAPTTIEQAVKAAASRLTQHASPPPEMLKDQDADEEFQLIPLHPEEVALGADDDLGNWKQSGFDATQLDLLRDDGIKTIGDVAGLAYGDLVDALGTDNLDPAFATDVILRAKLIDREIEAGEYPHMRRRWIDSINHERLG